MFERSNRRVHCVPSDSRAECASNSNVRYAKYFGAAGHPNPPKLASWAHNSKVISEIQSDRKVQLAKRKLKRAAMIFERLKQCALNWIRSRRVLLKSFFLILKKEKTF